ncbi:bifunctional acetaldehyde-CoA/alcohol dehydrogenase [Streptomyces sp. 4F14]|uniref:bifunctional acetaldehyde-CoA/alcohol dehydrogenase n=1 Tax=Streptomyces sp. 4F14 TaxID=3394380 RepID=UPI003A8A66FA
MPASVRSMSPTAVCPPQQVRDPVDTLVERAAAALAAFERLDQEQVDALVRKAALAALGSHMDLARLAVEETGRGLVEDKAVKNMFACERITHRMAGLRTVGVVSRDELDGIVEIADPVGVVAAIVPMTNPTSTVIFKSLIALKTRNPVVFSFPRAAQRCCAQAARIVRDAAVAAGAPAHCLQWTDDSSRQTTERLMRHPGVALILATGGAGLVRAAYSSGKPALGVGPGNVPAYVDEGADVARAVHDIVLSKTADHGMICASEQTVILHEGIADRALREFERLHAHVASPQEAGLLTRYFFGGDGQGAALNPDAVGRPAAWIADAAGFAVPADTSVLLAEVSGVGAEEPLTREKLCPVLSVVRVPDREHGIRLAERTVSFGGLGHTAAVHTPDERLAEEFGLRVKAVRVVWNSPSTHGGIGDVYNAFMPSLTLGCGTYGGNAVAGNVHAVNLLNIKRIGRRTTSMQWFKVPPRIYFEPHSLRYLADMPGVRRVMLVTGPGARRRGHVGRVLDVLGRRPDPVEVDVVDGVEAEPTLDTVRRGAARMRAFGPETVIALGGGSVMDAAKVMWLLYEHPDLDFADLRQKFSDIRKRVVAVPRAEARARLVCVPTTAGSGAEVTPFAVITDPVSGLKYPIADYAITPDVAICDPALTTDLPPAVTADSGFDALTHAVEAYVSVHASDFTDGLCLKAVDLVFGHLERAVRGGPGDPEARQRMHNAGTIAGMAFGNAFLGVVHAMSHTLGATYGVAHGRANALLLPHVIRYNGTVPGKLTGWPKYETYRAPERFQDIARVLGLPASDPARAVEELARAVEELRDKAGIEPSFQALGVPERPFLDALPEQAVNAYNDQCAPANPRMPLFTELETLMRTAYYGGRDPKG